MPPKNISHGVGEPTKPENPLLLSCEQWARPDDCGVFPAPVSSITLRDLFAAFALAGVARQDCAVLPDVAADIAYDCADAMLSRRAK